jgi:hypothetical protein
VLTQAIEFLPSGSHLIVEAFTELHSTIHSGPAPNRFAIAGELKQFNSRLRVLTYSEDWRTSKRHTARLFAQTI